MGFSTSLGILPCQPILASVVDHHIVPASVVVVALASFVAVVHSSNAVALELIQIPFWLFGNLPPSCYIIS